MAFCITGATLGLGSSAAAQLSAPEAGAWVMPRTPDGHPDLQGNWTNGTLTPFQRRRGQGPVLTWEEVADQERMAVARTVADAQPSDPDRPPPRVGGEVGSYNLVFIDRGDRVAVVNGEPRSSLLIKPGLFGALKLHPKRIYQRHCLIIHTAVRPLD